MILAGVTIPFDLGLDGHSDADIVCHAVTDAVLGAAAAGDIGRLFPDTDPTWKGADSIALLKGALADVHAAGYRVSNVDVTAISVKGKTNEGVDSMGCGEAMACHGIALLARS